MENEKRRRLEALLDLLDADDPVYETLTDATVGRLCELSDQERARSDKERQRKSGEYRKAS